MPLVRHCDYREYIIEYSVTCIGTTNSSFRFATQHRPYPDWLTTPCRGVTWPKMNTMINRQLFAISRFCMLAANCFLRMDDPLIPSITALCTALPVVLVDLPSSSCCCTIAHSTARGNKNANNAVHCFVCLFLLASGTDRLGLTGNYWKGPKKQDENPFLARQAVN